MFSHFFMFFIKWFLLCIAIYKLNWQNEVSNNSREYSLFSLFYWLQKMKFDLWVCPYIYRSDFLLNINVPQLIK
jgi:hypothetical protein